jgi:HTH-type transcriptional regulator, transcriptional repressor of NAD biosynthesis genes
VAHRLTGLVVGKFAPFHNGHKFVIDRALEEMDDVHVLLYSNPDFPEMPAHVRANWIRESCVGKPVTVHLPENPPPNEADDFTQREFVRVWLEANLLGTSVDCVFGSDAYIPGFAAHIGAGFVLVDAARDQHPVSGTQLRALMQNLTLSAKLNLGNCEYDATPLEELQTLVPAATFTGLLFWMQPVRRVVFMGAESTGKSTLTERMAREYDTAFVPEYGREVWTQKNGVLALSDYVHTAYHHRELEDAALLRAKRFLFVDTNAITTMFLGYAYEGDGLPELIRLAREAETRYHHVILCSDDIPFEQDGWRDHEFWRGRAQRLIRYDLTVRGIHHKTVGGNLEARVQQVTAILEGHK